MAVFFLISFLSSIVGAICGVGGGIIIKPTLDMLASENVVTINFLSCCTVLSMTCYSVAKSIIAKERNIQLKTATPMAIGAVFGGIFGKQMFTWIRILFSNASSAGAVQSVCLSVITLGTLIYTINKNKVKTRVITNFFVCAIIGLVLGMISSFLGIGGGPVNLVVLYYFFSMDTKTAAANSLYIILFSQAASLLTTLVSGVPPFQVSVLILMAAGGISGGIVGRIFNRKMNNVAVEKLFLVLMIVIIGISIYNVFMLIGG